ncbi:MAG: hypothetical protein ACK5YE_20755, partial [Planctomyces sp.]
ADGTVQENDTGLPVADSSKPVSASIFPAAGSEIGVAEWTNSPWIDVAYAAGAEKTLNTATILDVAAELELLGPDGSKVTVAAAPTQPEGFKEVNKFRYALPSGFTPQTGEYQVRFLAGTWADNSSNTNVARTEKIVVSAPTAVFAAPAGGGTVDRVALSTDKTLSVFFKPVGGGSIDSATILDADPEFTLSGMAAQGIILGAPAKSTENDYE